MSALGQRRIGARYVGQSHHIGFKAGQLVLLGVATLFLFAWTYVQYGP
jgi:hypothetical protein